MRKNCLIAIAAALCTVATACSPHKEPETENLWLRTLEPRLTGHVQYQRCRPKTGRPDEIVADVRCGAGTPVSAPPVSTSIEESCETMPVKTLDDANTILADHPRCADRVITALRPLAEKDPRAKSDLAAAYYVRAQFNDDPVDLLAALEAADNAVAAAPQSANAYFNRALAEEALGFREYAIASLAAFQRLETDEQWREEAQTRRNRLTLRGRDAARIWPAIRKQLRQASPEQLTRWVRQYPSAAQRFIEDELMPEWAESLASEPLQLADAIAMELSSLGNDSFSLDVVRSVDDANRESLREGFRRWGKARKAASNVGQATGKLECQAALAAFEAAHSPFQYAPEMLRCATKRLDAPDTDYVSLRARIQYQRGHHLLVSENQPIEALKAYDEALEDFIALKDSSGQAATRARRAGVLRVLGANEESWREALSAQRGFNRVTGTTVRTTIVAETATTAAALGYRSIARKYRDTYIESLRAEVPLVADDIVQAKIVATNLGFALRGRADLLVQLGQPAQAQRDLDEAARLVPNSMIVDSQTRSILQAQALQAQGRTSMRSRPADAIAQFTDALGRTGPGFFRTYRAQLLMQRAEAHRRAGNANPAAEDLRAAIAELHQEEESILARRKRGEGEEFWGGYFSRFRETYELLIRHFIAAGRHDEAFSYAERMRAFELLTLLNQKTAATLGIAELRQQVPAGTFVVEYFVLEDETLVWVISRDRGAVLHRLKVRPSDIDRWSAELQDAARDGKESQFSDALDLPFGRLLTEPLATISRMPGGGDRNRRLVFIPDRSLHGIPFAALRDPNSRRPLFDSAIVSVAGSASLYVHSLRRDAAMPAAQPPSALLVLDPAFDESLGLAKGRLAAASGERDSIGRHYRPHVMVLHDKGATVAQFLAHAPQHAIVHISAHGIPARDPVQSMLLLAPDDEDETGVLEAKELLNELRLYQTRLVVLAACSSAGGAPVGPEGVAPLVRPLIAAGVPGVVGSLWTVRDDDASTLMAKFHEHYKLGKDAAAALRDAQLDLLDREDSRALAWAPFQVIGHASSPFGRPTTTKPNTQRSH